MIAVMFSFESNPFKRGWNPLGDVVVIHISMAPLIRIRLPLVSAG